MDRFSIVYGYDALCGWCFGFIPVLQHFAKTHPTISVEVVPGGLFSGDRAQPYRHLVPHILNAQVHLERVTGRCPSEAFHSMIAGPSEPKAESAIPAHALLQVKASAPDRALEYAHALQEVHYCDGLDLNLATTYDTVSERLGIPKIDTEAALGATAEDDNVAAAYARAKSLGIRSYPSVLLVDAARGQVSAIPHEYDPRAFSSRFDEITKSSR